MIRKKFLILFFLFAVITAFNKDVLYNEFTGFQKPSNFPEPVYHFKTNPVTKDGFELGRNLFYETLLSADNTVGCGTCHIQSSSFTHHSHIVSHGIYDRIGTRNAPPIMNLAWSSSFMWDGGIPDLDLQPVSPITNHLEMDETMANVLTKLRNSDKYPEMFKKAFGSDDINTTTFLKALSQFVVMCVSSNSKYDSVMRHEDNKQFTKFEEEGRILVQQKCGGCHKEPLFTDYSFRNNGLQPGKINDEGRYLITQNETDKYKFKVPSLRNLAYTRPYMHDGRYWNLDEVLDHYSSHDMNMTNLDPLLQQNGESGIPLTGEERFKIITFLNTLNDKSFLKDKNLGEFGESIAR